jgi:hypothetical protein
MNQPTPPNWQQPAQQQHPQQQPSYQWDEQPYGYDRSGLYQRPSQSGYAKRSWWGQHLAELGGLVAGAIVGLVLGMIFSAMGADGWPGALPWIGAIVGAITLRWVARPRQAPPLQRR